QHAADGFTVVADLEGHPAGGVVALFVDEVGHAVAAPALPADVTARSRAGAGGPLLFEGQADLLVLGQVKSGTNFRDALGVRVKGSGDVAVGMALREEGDDVGAGHASRSGHQRVTAWRSGHWTLASRSRWALGRSNSGCPYQSRPAARSHQASH